MGVFDAGDSGVGVAGIGKEVEPIWSDGEEGKKLELGVLGIETEIKRNFG